MLPGDLVVRRYAIFDAALIEEVGVVVSVDPDALVCNNVVFVLWNDGSQSGRLVEQCSCDGEVEFLE